MKRIASQTATHQLSMPGMLPKANAARSATCCNVAPGQQVIYMGSVGGGPRFGSVGVVREARQRKAVVDMGIGGVWNIPYHFLSLPPSDRNRRAAA